MGGLMEKVISSNFLPRKGNEAATSGRFEQIAFFYCQKTLTANEFIGLEIRKSPRQGNAG